MPDCAVGTVKFQLTNLSFVSRHIWFVTCLPVFECSFSCHARSRLVSFEMCHTGLCAESVFGQQKIIHSPSRSHKKFCPSPPSPCNFLSFPSPSHNFKNNNIVKFTYIMFRQFVAGTPNVVSTTDDRLATYSSQKHCVNISLVL